MTSDCVLDASTAIEALTSKTETASALRDRLRETRAHAPHLLDAEVGSALRRQVRRGETSESQARALSRAAGALVSEHYPHHGPLAAAAWRLRENLTFYDALYVALVARLGIPLLTVDARLARAPGLTCTVESV